MSLARRLGERSDARRDAIVGAARRCFLRFGYDKTSLVDIAREARLSRTLLYLSFKSKDEILRAVFEAAFHPRYNLVAKLLGARASRLEKLAGACEQLFVAPWAGAGEFEVSHDFLRTCRLAMPALAAAHERQCVKYAEAVLGSRELAEVFTLAVHGLRRDSPTVATFRKRLHLLATRFAE